MADKRGGSFWWVEITQQGIQRRLLVEGDCPAQVDNRVRGGCPDCEIESMSRARDFSAILTDGGQDG